MKIRNWICLLIALVLYIPLGILQTSIDRRRSVEGLDTRILLMPGQVAGSLVLAGFRGIAADLLWLNIENYWHSGQHYKMLPLFEAVTFLQPQFITPWAVGGWHMSYNVFADVGRRRDPIMDVLENFRESAPEDERERLEPLLEIADRINSMIGFRQGMPESDIPELLVGIEEYKRDIREFVESEGDSLLVPLVAEDLASIPPEQLDWYRRGVTWLRRGIEYNRERYDLYFELGWTYFHKGHDFPNAVRFLEMAIRFPHPAVTKNTLAHAYENNGQPEKAVAVWRQQLAVQGFEDLAARAIRMIEEEGAFNPRVRRAMGLEEPMEYEEYW